MNDIKRTNHIQALPVLYSLRNCPYAIRARLAIYKAKQQVILRDVILSNKPAQMHNASPKGSVPVLVISESLVIDESLEIMLWALQKNDPENLLHSQYANALTEMLALINRFDSEFKAYLEQYKCAKRYQEDNISQCRAACETYIKALELRLTQQDFLFSEKESLVDTALLPFIRQFARVERQWYLQAPYPHLRDWLNRYLQSPMFTKVMAKTPLWKEGNATVTCAVHQ